MKKALILSCTLMSVALSSYYSFSQKQTKKPAAKSPVKTAPARATASVAKSNALKAEIEQGKDLVSKSDCLTCHQLQVKIIGPSYKSVAEKYTASVANINMLSDKIIKGGSGVWGQVAMAPHPLVKDADAKEMVRYVLSIK